MTKPSSYRARLKQRLAAYWRHSRWHKAVVLLCAAALLLLAGSYGIARWYIWSERNTPLTLGVSFIPDYASYLGLNPQKTMDALLNDLQIRHLRLVSYWTDGEPVRGQYDFSQLDWQFAKADAAHAKVTLSLGLRQPRWPECHMPDWAKDEPSSVWQPQLKAYIKAVVDRYKNNPALDSYQLENEYFLRGFGQCTDFSRQRLIDEFDLVKQSDPRHPVIISRSNNALGIALGKPQPDVYAISIYRRVWDQTLHTHRYLEYPFPAWYYAFLAGLQKIVTGKDTIVHELQAEAWPPNGQSILNTSLTEQNKSLDARRLQDRFEYGRATGMKTIYLWGAEYWYYRMTVLHDPSLWNVAHNEFAPRSNPTSVTMK